MKAKRGNSSSVYTLEHKSSFASQTVAPVDVNKGIMVANEPGNHAPPVEHLRDVLIHLHRLEGHR